MEKWWRKEENSLVWLAPDSAFIILATSKSVRLVKCLWIHTHYATVSFIAWEGFINFVYCLIIEKWRLYEPYKHTKLFFMFRDFEECVKSKGSKTIINGWNNLENSYHWCIN